LKGRIEAAKASLVRLRGSKCQVEEYIQSIQESLVKKRIKENEISQNNDSDGEEEKDAKLWRKLWKKLGKNLHHFRRQVSISPTNYEQLFH
jgi:hypothetical protein